MTVKKIKNEKLEKNTWVSKIDNHNFSHRISDFLYDQQTFQRKQVKSFELSRSQTIEISLDGSCVKRFYFSKLKAALRKIRN